MSLELDHIAIIVHNLDAALSYYIDYLGMRVTYREEQESAGVRAAYLDGGGAQLQLLEPIRPGPLQTFLEQHGEGLHHICLAVPDIPAFLSRLPGEKNTPLSTGGGGRRTCFLQNTPEGVSIELIERASVESTNISSG
jgi:methylmalonyl-CoA/ethylmalonyl-CoA epimerase